MAKRIDSIKNGQRVTLRFMANFQGKDGAWDEDMVFDGIDGDGDDREARFKYLDSSDHWKAYRFNGRWVYGSSAETLRLITVHED